MIQLYSEFAKPPKPLPHERSWLMVAQEVWAPYLGGKLIEGVKHAVLNKIREALADHAQEIGAEYQWSDVQIEWSGGDGKLDVSPWQIFAFDRAEGRARIRAGARACKACDGSGLASHSNRCPACFGLCTA